MTKFAQQHFQLDQNLIKVISIFLGISIQNDCQLFFGFITTRRHSGVKGEQEGDLGDNIMLLIEIAKHNFETQIYSKAIDKPSYNLRSYDFLIFTYKCFGSTRSQVRILSPRLNQNQVILASYPDSLFYRIIMKEYVSIKNPSKNFYTL